MKRLKYILIGVLLINFSCKLTAQEFRAGIEYNKGLLPNLNTGVKYQLRDNFNTKNNYNNLIQAALKYKVNKHLYISGSYRHSIGKESNRSDSDDNTFEKNRVTTEITYKSKRISKKIKIHNRFRYQHSWGNNEKDKQFFRNRIKFDYKLSDNTKPFVSFEPYYHIKSKEVNKVRTSLGSQFQLKHNKIDVFIITEAKIKPSGLVTSHFVGFTYYL